MKFQMEKNNFSFSLCYKLKKLGKVTVKIYI